GLDDFAVSPTFPKAFLIVLIGSVFGIYFLESFEKTISNFSEHLWKSFVTSSVCLLVLLSSKTFYVLIDSTFLSENVLLNNFIYHINLVFFIILISNLYFLFRKMVLYQKTKSLVNAHKVFEVVGIAAVFLTFTDFKFTNIEFLILFIPFMVFSAFMSVHLKWIAYLKFRQKLNTIIIMILILGIVITFMQYLYDRSVDSFLILDITGNVFLASISSFLLLYSSVSILVLFFNLPTSSVFEKKFDEVLNFQRLSQVVQIGQEESQVYEVLFEGSKATVNAKAGWLEIFDSNGNIISFLNHQINKEKSISIKTLLRKNEIVLFEKTNYIKDLTVLKHQKDNELRDYRSLIILPLQTYSQKLGLICFLSNVSDGFDNEMVEILETYVAQASISIHNSRLVNDAIENERFKESAKIAMGIQSRLLPKTLPYKEKFEIEAYCEMAGEVGGDYYDLYSYSESEHAIIIGDVSGKGTNAAFQMALMKGVFQSLVRSKPQPLEFVSQANCALADCLDKNTFITAIFGVLNEKTMKFKFVRAGQCPILHFSRKTKKTIALKNKGLGLGIIRNKHIDEYFEECEIELESGDILLLFTDGITETKNINRTEYGLEKLMEQLNIHHAEKTQDIIKKIVDDVSQFAANHHMDDDSTLVVIKMK
ncbi:MAG: SpoIIE family protein phosphatase, partial [Cytophagales bacterium]